MRLAGVVRRVVSPAAPSSTARRAPARIAVAIGAILALACQGDSPTDPMAGARPVPTEPMLELTGGVGTPIFPTTNAGDVQPVGVAVGLNDAGQVTGSQFGLVMSDLDFKPYRWSPGTGAVKLFGCCDTQWGNDINDAGTVVGVAHTNALRGNHAWVATGTTMTTLPALAGSNSELSSGAIAINNAGQIVGVSPATGGAYAFRAVLWNLTGAVEDLGTLGGTNSGAIDINDAGQVIGSSQIAGDAATHFFLWSAGTGMQDLNSIIDPNLTSVVEINASGQIIGTYTTSGGGSHAFLYTPGSGLRDLGTLGGATSAPTGMNDNGDVVGSSALSDGSTHAFLWTAANGMEDITALTGVPEVRRLNDKLQTLTGTRAPSTNSVTGRLRPRLVQLQVTQSNTPPTALFTIECNGLTCALDASASLDDKPGLTYAWDVNKYPGPFAQGEKVAVTYPHASQRTITLTATDANGLTDALSKTITVSDFPLAAFTYSCTVLTCSFDSGGSTNDGNPITYRIWDFGDDVRNPSNLQAAPSHTYAQPGTYTVKLEVWGRSSSERAIVSQQVTVASDTPQNQPPVANFTYSCDNFVCTLNGTGSTDDKGVVSYAWSLGKAPDGTAGGPTVTTDYWHAGPRTVTLTVSDAEGSTSSITKTIDVGATEPDPELTDGAPVARFTSSCSGTVCTLDASTSTDDVGIASYSWSLGKAPEGSATGVTVSTDYWHTSTRTVTLTVTDTKGQTNSVTQTVMVP